MDRPKNRPTTIPSKQAAHILREKYRKQLDQRPEGTNSEAGYATEQVERAGRLIADEVKACTPQPSHRQRQNPLKQREKPTTPKEEPTYKTEKTMFKTRPTNNLKTKEAQEQAKPRQPSPNIPKQRAVGPTAKETVSRATPSVVSTQEAAPSSTQEAGRQAFVSYQRSRPRGELPTPSGGNTVVKSAKDPGVLKERPRTIFKNKSSISGKTTSPAPKVKPSAKAIKTVKQTAQCRMRQQALTGAKQAAKVATDVGQKAAAIIAKEVAALISNLAVLLGGGVLLAIFISVAAIAAIASSPFGIFFSGGGGTGGSSIPTVSVSEAVSSINMEYNTRLEQLQAGGYDGITLTGQAADWPDVLAVFASRYAAAEDGVDVATLDADRVSKLTAVFWDMTTITTEVETIDHDDSDPDDDIDDSWTERILHIIVTLKTAEDMKTAYSFIDYQISALDELLADPVALASLAGNLSITNADVQAVVNALPVDISSDRRKAVETALQLVGKVNYFWGGKSYGIGWDSRWGQLMKVTAGGDSTTGTYRPYGLDCTGFIDWTLRNAGLSSDGHWYIGTNLTEVSEDEAMPGDLALYPDASHIGMVVGRDSTGKLLICHCSRGANNVVISNYITSGFTSIGRPAIYEP